LFYLQTLTADFTAFCYEIK